MKEFQTILNFISQYFEKNSICDSLIHFGSSLNTDNFKDIDLICYFEDFSPKSHYNVLKSLFYFKDKFPNINFSYNEYSVGVFIKNQLNFSFIPFGKGIKKYKAFSYSVSLSNNILFGLNPIKNIKKPTKKDCLEYSVMLHNIKKDFPQLQLKSYLRNSLLIKELNVEKNKLIETFEKEFNYKISTKLKLLFKTEKYSKKTFIELENLYKFILDYFNFKDSDENRKELIGNSKIIKFRIKVFDEMNLLLKKKEPKEKILNYLNKEIKTWKIITKK